MTIATSLSHKDILAYAPLAMPLAFAGMPLYVHAPDFYTTQLGAPLSMLGVILLALRLIDAIQDPLIGWLSDKFKDYQKYIIGASSITLILGFYLLFQPPVAISPLIWFSASMLIATSAYSVLSINLNVIGGLWSTNHHEKTRIAAWREFFGLLGLLTAVVLPSALSQYFPASRAFLIVSIVLTILMALTLTLFLLRYKRAKINTIANRNLNTDTFYSLKKISLQSRYFYLIYAVSVLASSIPALLVLFFVRDRLDAETYIGLFLALYFLSGALGMPIWEKLSKSYGKYNAWVTGMSLAAISFAWAVFLTPETAGGFAIICVLSGLALGSDLALPPSILADHLHNEQKESSASYHFGLLAFLTKSALALASILTFPVLEAFGYIPGQQNESPALISLSIAYAGLPCILKFIAILLLLRFRTRLITGDPNA